MDIIEISHHSKNIKGEVFLEGSKSISNRLLIIQALSGNTSTKINHLSASNDTIVLQRMLNQPGDFIDAEDCGTAFRFMTAYLCLQQGEQVLSGSERLKERPIAPLVDALREAGAQIEYLEKEGFAPLRIGKGNFKAPNIFTITAHISSQFISALCLIGPRLAGGCTIILKGKMSSLPYIEMTLNIMRDCGVQVDFDQQSQIINIKEQDYILRVEYQVEADWSAAAFYYSIVNCAEIGSELFLHGLRQDSNQGDVKIVEIGEFFGIETVYTEEGIRIRKVRAEARSTLFSFDFSHCPDLAQAVMVMCAAAGVKGEFNGLESLYVKETNRVEAMKQELAKFSIVLQEDRERVGCAKLSGKFQFDTPIRIETYQDHRIAMAFAPLAMIHTLEISNPAVVRKSYPGFWEDLKGLGFANGLKST